MASDPNSDLFDIDAHLAKLSGEQNYMNSLKQITGDIWDINMDFWKPKSEQICKCNNNIMKLLTYLSNVHAKKDAIKYKEIIETKDAFEKEYNKMDMENKALEKDKKDRYHVGFDYRGDKIVKTEWFSQIRKLEKAVTEYLGDILDKNYMKDITDFKKMVSTTVLAVNAVLAKHPEFKEIKKILGCEVTESNIESFVQIKEFCTIIINNYMYPMYDIKKKIMNNYDKLDKIFKTKGAQQKLGIQIATEEVVSILERFIVAKYRKEITGNSEHYTKLFMSIVGDDSISEMSGPRLLELMDSINLDLIQSNKNAYKFANGAKSMIKKLVSGDSISAEESIKEIRNLFEEGEKTPEASKVVEIDDAENDIL